MGKITKRAATEYDLFDEPLLKIGKRRKTTLPAISSTTIAAKPEKVDEICQGKEFCVLNAPKFTHTTKDLEAVIIKHGGIIGKVFFILHKLPFISQIPREIDKHFIIIFS